MTMNHRVIENLEIAFWNTTIPAMTGARLLRQSIEQVKTGLLKNIPSRVLLQSLVWSVIGLVFGLLLGISQAGL